MPNRKDYGQDLFKQVQELISKCDNLSHELKKERKERQKEKEQFNKLSDEEKKRLIGRVKTAELSGKPKSISSI